jgi:DNA-directed RNA polymerase specialized sigma24 family protein
MSSSSPSPPETTQAEFLQAFGALSDDVLERIVRYARRKANFLELDSQDLINDAVLRFVKGDRQWTPKTLEKDFIQAIRSISSNLYASQVRRKEREIRFVGAQFASPSLDEQIDHAQWIRLILRYFEARNDEDAILLINAMLRFPSAKSAANELGFTPERLEAVLRRIRRHVRSQWSTKKK